MNKKPAVYGSGHIELLIVTVRAQKVILDSALAAVYGVRVKVLNQAVKRNAQKFPPDFMFQLSPDEAIQTRSLRSQTVTLKRGRHRKYLPYAFTEHGAIMAATVLNSPRAVQMSIFVVRAFVKMRQLLLAQTALARRLAVLEKTLTRHLASNEAAIVDALREIMRLLTPVPDTGPLDKPQKQIGFTAKEKRAKYLSAAR